MTKAALFPALLIAACLIAGLYGALHNQISYTVSPEYFHQFKFDQFDIPESFRNRFGASLVGWHASWAMGLLVGVPILFLGLIMPDSKSYLVHNLIACVLLIIITLAIGLSALADEPYLSSYRYPGVVDKEAYARVGSMHSSSYKGGFIGGFIGCMYLIGARIYLALRPSRLQQQPRTNDQLPATDP
jgi:hypothetical protein